MFNVAKNIRLKPSRSRSAWVLSLSLLLGLGLPALNPPPAEALCFFWQACARRRGEATNTRAGGKRTGRILGGNDATIPYVISPRNAWIQAPGQERTYMIRWNPVADASGYTVRLWRWTFERDRPELAFWETTVEATNQIPFPEQVFLEPGTYYSVEVVTDTGISSNLDEGFYRSGFQLLFEEDYEVLRSQLAEITPEETAETAPIAEDIPEETVETAPTAEDIPEETAEDIPEETVLATAGVFFLEAMYADALAVLQPRAERSDASDLIYTALGDTYSKSGLNQLALDAYQRALTLATDTNNHDVLSEATIRVSLADVYATLGLHADALEQLQEARKAYEELQEETEIARLDIRIQILDSRLSKQRESESTP